MTDSRILVVVGGPTASGKTDMAVKIAAHFSTEIISADSRQLFRELTIGTAKPNTAEMQGVPHHFINSHSVTEDFSAGDFSDRAAELIEQLFSENQVVVVAGGSGLYIDALLYGVDEMPGKDEDVRNELNELYRRSGIVPLQDELKKVDPETYEEIDIHNPQRIIRALEVFRSTGEKASSLRKLVDRKPRWPYLLFGIRHDREELYRRINERVDRMFEEGLEDEVRGLSHYRDLNALQTVGYKEVLKFLDDEISRDECIELVKKNSRNYAKRQITWFRRYPEMEWVEPDEVTDVISTIAKKLAVRD